MCGNPAQVQESVFYGLNSTPSHVVAIAVVVAVLLSSFVFLLTTSLGLPPLRYTLCLNKKTVPLYIRS